MPRYLEQVIRTYVSTDPSGLAHEWDIELDIPDDALGPFGFRARGRNGSFIPRWISVSRHNPPPGGRGPATIVIEVRNGHRTDAAPIELELPWTYAASLARTSVKAARSVDHTALDAIAKLLDGREWNGADDLDTIAALLRGTGRDIAAPGDASPEQPS
jgi:hypothetical protein